MRKRSVGKTQSRVKVDEHAPARPPCATCGHEATCVLSLDVRDLVLERDSGVHSAPYWTSSYKSVVVDISTRLCAECVRAYVKVSMNVRAEVVKDEDA